MLEVAESHLEEEAKKEKIKVLEQMGLGKAQIAEAILVFLGLKPATEITVYKWNEDSEKIKRKMEELGLVLKDKELRKKESKKLVTKFVIAQDNSTVDKLINVEANKDHEEYGKLMGYPDTAVSAFSNKSELLPDEEYPDMKGIIFAFKMSKDHHGEEFEILKNWSEAIKKYSPDIYNELNTNDVK